MPPSKNKTRPTDPPSGLDEDRRGAGAESARRTGVVGAIPARYASTRLPGKPLLRIAGKPMIEHVYRRASAAPGLDGVVVLTDDERIARAVEDFGGDWQMTPAECSSGTDRIAWAVRGWSDDVRGVVNVQGDEPLIDPEVVDRVARHLASEPDDPVVTLATSATAEEEKDPNAVKVVVDRDGYALYFSRSAIPYRRDAGPGGAAAPPLKHLGIYGYQKAALLRLAELPPTPLEQTEALEQLRALEHRIPLRVLKTDKSSPGVDTREDMAEVERLLAGRPATR